MSYTPISLCSKALLTLGAETISSFDEGTVEAEICANLYESIRDALISSHPWSFATAQITLARLAGIPILTFDQHVRLAHHSDGRARGGGGCVHVVSPRLSVRRNMSDLDISSKQIYVCFRY